MQVFVLSNAVEKAFSDAITVTEQDSFMALEPVLARSLLEKIRKAIQEKSFDGYPVLLASSNIRLHVRRFVEHLFGNLVVLSHSEIPPHVRLVSLGDVE
jgi:flagellar biosynthesis protein FlhA